MARKPKRIDDSNMVGSCLRQMSVGSYCCLLKEWEGSVRRDGGAKVTCYKGKHDAKTEASKRSEPQSDIRLQNHLRNNEVGPSHFRLPVSDRKEGRILALRHQGAKPFH
jgi:hypothetical protein